MNHLNKWGLSFFLFTISVLVLKIAFKLGLVDLTGFYIFQVGFLLFLILIFVPSKEG